MTVVVPHDEVEQVAKVCKQKGVEFLGFDAPAGRGEIMEMTAKCNAHEYTEASYILHLDAASIFTEPVTPSTLAHRAGLSPPQFARLMKRLFGLTPSQFIAKTRIAVASCLLRETTQSVSDIALACGFYDHSAFTRACSSARFTA